MFDEMISAVRNINNDIIDITKNIDFDYLTFGGNADIQHIYFLGNHIWDSENDPRDEGDNVMEPLENYLRRIIDTEILPEIAKITLYEDSVYKRVVEVVNNALRSRQYAINSMGADIVALRLQKYTSLFNKVTHKHLTNVILKARRSGAIPDFVDK